MHEEERYNNRQIEKMFTDQSADLKAHMDLVTRPILVQTTKTNGRVNVLEEKVQSQKSWRTGLTYGGAVLFFFMTTLILPVLTWNLLQTIQLKESIRQDVQAAAQTGVDKAFDQNLQVNP